MRAKERISGIFRAPRLASDVLLRGQYRFVYDQMPVTIKKMSIAKRLNLFRSGLNLLHRRLSPWNMPLHMQFELTNYCNLRCPVCPTGIHAVRRKAQSMPPDLFQRVIDQVGPYLLTASLWAWGEPNLHPQLQQILKAARTHRFATLLSTNGHNLTDERVIKAIIEEPPTYLIVAIDGLTDEINSIFRKGAKLQNALEGIRILADLKKKRGSVLPVLHMRFIVMKHNQHQVPQLQEFARDHHFDLLTVRTLSIIDTESPDEAHREMIPDDAAFCAYNYDCQSRLAKKDFYCLEPFWFPTVFADGTVVSCEQDYNAQLPMGHITEKDDFRSIWYGTRAQSVRKAVRDQATTLSFCRNCPYRDRDTTDCSIEAHFLSNDIPYSNLI
jgi:radical SAM protein with 4Fe4S-binding SPASM domain